MHTGIFFDYADFCFSGDMKVSLQELDVCEWLDVQVTTSPSLRKVKMADGMPSASSVPSGQCRQEICAREIGLIIEHRVCQHWEESVLCRKNWASNFIKADDLTDADIAHCKSSHKVLRCYCT